MFDEERDVLSTGTTVGSLVKLMGDDCSVSLTKDAGVVSVRCREMSERSEKKKKNEKIDVRHSFVGQVELWL